MDDRGAAVDDGPAVSDDAFRRAFHDAPTGMAVLRPGGELRAVNRALGELLHVHPDDLVGRTLFAVTHPEDVAGAHEACRSISDGTAELVRHECRFLRADGTPVWVQVSTSTAVAPAEPGMLIMHVEDVTLRKQVEAELTHRALHDPLTGLANRTLLLERLGHLLAVGRRQPSTAALVVLDLNGFKDVNDTLGHGAGDAVLVEVAERLTAELRPGDTAARIGGDEFTVLCESCADGEGAVVADRLRAVLREPFVLPGGSVRLSAAVGVTLFDTGRPDGDTQAALARVLHLADLAMYDDKRGGA